MHNTLINISGKTCGLCGNYNDNQNDDFTSPSGSIEVSPNLFGDTWRVKQFCADAKTPKHPCKVRTERAAWSKKTCSIIKQKVFKPCHDVVRNIHCRLHIILTNNRNFKGHVGVQFVLGLW